MKAINIRNIIKNIKAVVDNHALNTPGEYARYLWQNERGDRKMGSNEYGCADAMNILYTINDFYCDAETRAARIRALQAFQDKESGMFHEDTHHTIHTTAHCTAALQLFDVKPLYPLTYLHKYMTREALHEFLDNEVDWNNPWPQSHKGAGIYAALVNADEMTPEFQRDYFDWFLANADEKTGFWKKGYAERAPISNQRYPNGKNEPDSIFAFMAGGFHYMFNHEYAKMPLLYPDKVIDTCIEMYEKGALPTNFGRQAGFIEIDWVYCINRASRQSTHRRDEVVALLEDFAVKFADFFNNVDWEHNDSVNDLHMLFGSACCFAELQAALPGKIITDKPLRLVLDRRPFI